MVSESLDRKLPLTKRIGVSIHLSICWVCPEAKKQMRFIRNVMRYTVLEDAAIDSEISLSQETRDRIRLALIQR